MTGNVVRDLQARGRVDAITGNELIARTDQPLRVYCGFDPTSDSLHLGNLATLMGLAWFQRAGHTPFAVVGGATGMIGDPSGKSHERPHLDSATIERNIAEIRKNLETVLDFDCGNNSAVLLNNLDWYQEVTFINFLRDIGRHFRVGPMMAKESVKTRLNSAEGMSFTEFAYQVLQGYDFLHLFDHHEVQLEIGGTDQWGNITAGTELIRKTREATVHGLTMPLLTRSDGKKFGKTEKGAIWLSPERLSPYEFYQYLVRVPDADVIALLKALTFVPTEEIYMLANDMTTPNYAANTAQKRLAKEVTRIVHGDNGLQTALEVTKSLRPGQETILNAGALETMAQDVPSTSLPMPDVVGQKLVDVMVSVGLQASKGAAKRLIRQGGAYLNNQRIDNPDYVIDSSQLVENRLLLLATGKKSKLLVRINP